jgi:IS5 family transposase
MLKKGTLLDASIVAAAHKPPPKQQGMGEAHPREPGADWVNKAGKSYFGYKLHVGVDQGSGLIRSAIITSARVQDVEVAEALVAGDEAAVYADRAYESKAHRAHLRAAGIKDPIMHRRHKHMRELPRWQARRNDLIARRRAPVEAVFAAMKRIYGRARARCHSLLANAADLIAFASVFNLRRAANVLRPEIGRLWGSNRRRGNTCRRAIHRPPARQAPASAPHTPTSPYRRGILRGEGAAIAAKGANLNPRRGRSPGSTSAA